MWVVAASLTEATMAYNEAFIILPIIHVFSEAGSSFLSQQRFGIAKTSQYITQVWLGCI